MTTLASLPSHIYFFAAILAVLLLSFVIFSLLPSFVVSRQLSGVIKKLTLLNGKHDGSLDQIFANKGVLEHLWQEYADSLHRQVGDGQSIRMRSTMPAGMVFRPDILVDIPLRSDFFKHLPGLFTGVGIIGTFYGLLIGMRSFVVSDNPAVVRESLTRLLHGVSEAFLISASAITLAMIVTFIEKLLVSRLNAKVEHLVQLLDGLFEGGAGEEYLARLVSATESSSVQTAGLLKVDLKQILTDLIDRQIAAAHDGSLVLGDRITDSIESSMRAPLAEMVEALKNAQKEQSDTGPARLAEALDEFSSRMKAMLDAQSGDKGDLQRQTLAALGATLNRLEAMAQQAGSAAQRNTDAIIEQFARANAAAESRQAMMNDKMSEFIEQMRKTAIQSQADMQAQLQASLDALSGYMGAVVEGLGVQVKSASDAGNKHQQALEEQSMSVIEQLGGQVAGLVDGMNSAVAQMQSAVASMHTTTSEAMAALGQSADTLYLASKDFSLAGESVSSSLGKTAGVADQLIQAADSVAVASDNLSEMFGDYRAARDSMMEQVRSLQTLADHVRSDASMSGDVLARIASATDKLVEAQKDADTYLSRVSEVIAVAHQSFSEGMTRAVGEANRDFHQALSDSVKLLREGIHELESTLDAATSL